MASKYEGWRADDLTSCRTIDALLHPFSYAADRLDAGKISELNKHWVVCNNHIAHSKTLRQRPAPLNIATGPDNRDVASTPNLSSSPADSAIHLCDEMQQLKSSLGSTTPSCDTQTEFPAEIEDTDTDTSVNDSPSTSQSKRQSVIPTLPELDLKTCTEPFYQNPSISVAESKVAGWGAFAATDLKFGDIILREKPLFLSDVLEIREAYDKLEQWAKDVTLSLHAHIRDPDMSLEQAVWHTNCFRTAGYNQAGLFPISARFNHACHPANNVDYAFDSSLGCLTLTVRVDNISAGEELRICYGGTREELRRAYGFWCDCGECDYVCYHYTGEGGHRIQW